MLYKASFKRIYVRVCFMFNEQLLREYDIVYVYILNFTGRVLMSAFLVSSETYGPDLRYYENINYVHICFMPFSQCFTVCFSCQQIPEPGYDGALDKPGDFTDGPGWCCLWPGCDR